MIKNTIFPKSHFYINLAIIMTILLISICLLALVRYGISYRRKKQKDQEMEDEQRIISTSGTFFECKIFCAEHLKVNRNLP